MTKPRVQAIDVSTRSERDVLKTPQRPGFARRLVKNDPIRIEEMEELGYRVVQKEDGGPFVRREFVVMETPQDLHDARQAAKVAEVRRQREALSRSVRRDLEGVTQKDEFRGKTGIIGGVSIEGGGS